MDPVILIPGAIALVLLALTVYLLLRPNPLQSRLEELLQERSRRSASLEHATRTLEEEKSRARAELASEQQRAARQLADAEERAAKSLAEAEQRAAGQLAEVQQRAAGQLAEQKQ